MMKKNLSNFTSSSLSRTQLKSVKGGTGGSACGSCGVDQNCYYSAVYYGDGGKYNNSTYGVVCASSATKCEATVRKLYIWDWQNVDAHCC